MQVNPEAKQNRFALADQRNRGRAAGCMASSAERSDRIAGQLTQGMSLGLEITILVGTMTGTAQLVAQELELRLDDGETAARAVLMDNLNADAIEPNKLYLICSSTYGQGDVPDNAKQLYESLQTQRPDLASVSYGVIALGDRTYNETFCNGGRRFDQILGELGAKRIGDILLHDASAGTMPEEVAAEWIDGWVALCKEQLGEAV